MVAFAWRCQWSMVTMRDVSSTLSFSSSQMSPMAAVTVFSLTYSFRTNANDFSYYIVSIQFIYLNVRSWFNLFGMIKGGTRDKQCAGGAGKVSCSGDGVQSKSRRKGVLVWCGSEKMKFSDFETTVEFFGLNWQLIELAS